MLGIFNKISSSVRQGFKRYVTDGLKLYMPYKQKTGVVGFVGTGSTSFDGSNDYVDCGTSLGTALGDNYAGSLTVTMWFKADVTSGDDGLFNMSSFSGTHGEMGIAIDSNSIKFHLNNGGWTRSFSFTDTSSWHHLVCVYDTSGEDASLMYLDGVSVGSVSGTFPADSDMDLSGLKVILGAYYSSSYTFNGNIKNVAIWNRALTATEVQNVMYKSYAEVSGRLADGLVSWWALDAGSLGSDLSDNNCAVSDGLTEANATTGWDGYDGSALTSVSTNPYSGSYHFHCVGIGNRVGASSTVSGLGTGKRYQVVAYVKSSDITNVSFRMDGGSFSETTSLVADTWTRISTIWDADDGNVLVVITSVSNEDALKSIDIDNVSIKEISTEDLKGSNDGEIFGAVIDEDLYGSDTPVKPRAIDNARTVQADAIGAGSASFDGSNDGDEIICGNDSSLAINGDMTVTAWLNPTNATDTAGLIVKRDGGGTNYQFDIPTDRKFRVFDGAREAKSATALTLGEWAHVAFTIDSGQAGGTNCYINGVNDALTFDSGTTITITSDDANLVLGHNEADGSNGHYGGYMSQVGIWDAVLTQAQIQSIMEKTYEELTASEKEDLVSYWALDESIGASGSNDAVYDKVDETLGSELIADSTFDRQTYWVPAIAGGNLDNEAHVAGQGFLDVNVINRGKLTAINAEDINLYKNDIMVSGKLYKLSITIDSYTDGRINGAGESGSWNFTPSGAGTFNQYFHSTGDDFNILFDNSADFTATDISLKQVGGNGGILI